MRKSLSPADLGFDPHDRRQLAKALVEVKNARLFHRIQAVLLVARGRRFQETAQITGLGYRSVYRLVSRYLNSHQVESLADKPRSGRPLEAPGNGSETGRFLVLYYMTGVEGQKPAAHPQLRLCAIRHPPSSNATPFHPLPAAPAGLAASSRSELNLKAPNSAFRIPQSALRLAAGPSTS